MVNAPNKHFFPDPGNHPDARPDLGALRGESQTVGDEVC